MCIALLSTAHPRYSLILLNNRDEYLTRPTAKADWWDSPNSQVIGGRDLLRPERGTWLGMTKAGRVAVLTNFRDEGVETRSARSRGAMVNAVLTQPSSVDEYPAAMAKHLVEDEGGLKGVGGFSLVFGKVGAPLAVVSNRTASVEDVAWIGRPGIDKTVGLSNALITNRSWPKVLNGEQLLQAAIEDNVDQHLSEEDFIQKLFQLLSVEQLPKRPTSGKEANWENYVKELRKSIFLPVIGGNGMDGLSVEEIASAQIDADVVHRSAKGDGLSGIYGTQKQTAILVDHKGHVTFVERTLYDGLGRPTSPSQKERRFEFDIDS